MLCLPLLRQEEFSGCCTWRTAWPPTPSRPARIALLGHLASQAAISIENARLYADVQRAEAALRRANDELEQRVEERTRELKQAQAQLVDTARAAGMAEVASNVLHNVGNVLTSAVINLETMQQAVGASRVGRLKQVAALLAGAPRATWRTSSRRDPRGAQPAGLPLAPWPTSCCASRRALQEGLDAMGRHIEHIRAIVQVQQTYARRPRCSPRSATWPSSIDDALRIQMAALQRHGVTVTRELAAAAPGAGGQAQGAADPHQPHQQREERAWTRCPRGSATCACGSRREGERARIQVVDNGMGIAPEVPRAALLARLHHAQGRARLRPALERAGGADAGGTPHAGERRAGQGRHGHAGAPAALGTVNP